MKRILRALRRRRHTPCSVIDGWYVETYADGVVFTAMHDRGRISHIMVLCHKNEPMPALGKGQLAFLIDMPEQWEAFHYTDESGWIKLWHRYWQDEARARDPRDGS